MSGAPPRRPHGHCVAALNGKHVCPRAAGTRASSTRCAQSPRQLLRTPARPGVMACGLALRCSFPAGHACLPRPPPRGLPSQGYSARSCVACVMVVRRLRRRATQRRSLQAVQAAVSSCTALAQRVSSHAVKGPLRRCAPLTEPAPAKRDQAAKEKTACLRARARAKMRL